MKIYLDALDHCGFGNERNTHTHTHTERLMRLSKNHIESGVLVLNYYKFFLFKNIHFPELCMEKD